MDRREFVTPELSSYAFDLFGGPSAIRTPQYQFNQGDGIVSASRMQFDAPTPFEAQFGIASAVESQPLYSNDFKVPPSPSTLSRGQERTCHASVRYRQGYDAKETMAPKLTYQEKCHARVQAHKFWCEAEVLCDYLNVLSAKVSKEWMVEAEDISCQLARSAGSIASFIERLFGAEENAETEAERRWPQTQTSSLDLVSLRTAASVLASVQARARAKKEPVYQLQIGLKDLDRRRDELLAAALKDRKRYVDMFADFNKKLIVELKCDLHQFRSQILPEIFRQSVQPSMPKSKMYDGTTMLQKIAEVPAGRATFRGTPYERSSSRAYQQPSTSQVRPPSPIEQRSLPSKSDDPSNDGLIPYSFLNIQPKPDTPCMYCGGYHYAFLCYSSKYNTLEKRLLYQTEYGLCQRCQKQHVVCDRDVTQYCRWLTCCSRNHHSNVCHRAPYPITREAEADWAAMLQRKQREALPIYKLKYPDLF